MTLQGKAALITGGGTGIGRATAERFAQEGAKVLICGRRKGPLQETASTYPEAISFLPVDVASTEDRTQALRTIVDRYGQLDILVNNAGVSVVAPFEGHTPDQIKLILDVNLTSPMLLTLEALPLLKATKGSIINVSSAGARYQGMPPAGITPYSASKAGLNQWSKTLATELGPDGIRVNVVAPGLTETEIAASAFETPEFAAAAVANTPLGRYAQPEDIARVIYFLASEEAGWVTGQIIDATGGLWLSP